MQDLRCHLVFTKAPPTRNDGLCCRILQPLITHQIATTDSRMKLNMVQNRSSSWSNLKSQDRWITRIFRKHREVINRNQHWNRSHRNRRMEQILIRGLSSGYTQLHSAGLKCFSGISLEEASSSIFYQDQEREMHKHPNTWTQNDIWQFFRDLESYCPEE